MDPDGEMGTARRRLQHSQSTVEGETSDLGRFHLNIIPRPNNKTIGTNDDVETATLTARLAEEQSFRIKEIVQAMLRARIEQLLQSDPNAAQNPPPPQQLFMLSDHQQQSPNEQPNFYLQQLRLKVPFSLDIHFSFGNDKIIERGMLSNQNDFIDNNL
jgi:hypothetical protein